MNLAEALELMKAGQVMCREAWKNGRQLADIEGHVCNINAFQGGWEPTIEDLEANDWKQCFEDKEKT